MEPTEGRNCEGEPMNETERKVQFLVEKWRIPRDEARRLLNIERAEASDD